MTPSGVGAALKLDLMELFRMTHCLRARRALLLLSLPLAGLCGCSMFEPKPVTAPAATVIVQPGKATLQLTEAGTGSRVVLERAQTLVVSLAVAGNQSPDWVIVGLPDGFVVAAGPRFERTGPRPNADDAAGSTVWHLRAGTSGEFTLRFELRRPRSTLPPLQIVSYTVQVQ